MTTHELKVQPQFWDALASGANPSNIRRDDRKFRVGDTCILKRYDPSHGFTGQSVERVITHILMPEDFPNGLPAGYVILGFGYTSPELRQCGWLQFHPIEAPKGDLETQSLTEGDRARGWIQEPIYRMFAKS